MMSAIKTGEVSHSRFAMLADMDTARKAKVEPKGGGL